MNLTIPKSDDDTLEYSQCHVYVSSGAGNLNPANFTREKCTEWVYETSEFKSTFTSEVNITYVMIMMMMMMREREREIGQVDKIPLFHFIQNFNNSIYQRFMLDIKV